jgi:hypothetical protein
MDLKNMRENGVRSLLVRCLECNDQRSLNMDAYPGHVTVKSFESRMVCTSCGAMGADVRPDWSSKPVPIPKP